MATNKAKGTGWAEAIVRYLIASGLPGAERRVQFGVNDRGDVATGIEELVIEAKNVRRIDLSTIVKELEAEVANQQAHLDRIYGAETRKAFGLSWIKRPRFSGPDRAYVVMDGATALHLLKKAGYFE